MGERRSRLVCLVLKSRDARLIGTSFTVGVAVGLLISALLLELLTVLPINLPTSRRLIEGHPAVASSAPPPATATPVVSSATRVLAGDRLKPASPPFLAR